MSTSEEVKFTLKVLMHKEQTKVAFAEVDSSFADVLLSFLTLPLGTIVRLLNKQFTDQAPTIGSLNTLYQSASNLESGHFWTDKAKEILLNTRNSFAPLCQKLKLNLDDSGEPTKYFKCSSAWCWRYVIMNNSDTECKCGCMLDNEAILTLSKIQTASNDDDGVFTKESATFLITDDLVVVPNLAVALIQILNNLGITDTDELVETTVSVGFKEMMDLLKASLFSRTPLTDLVLHKSPMDSTNTVIPQLQSSVPQTREVDYLNKKITVKVIIRKSTNKVLLVQAEGDFVDFLFSFLTIPLGQVIRLLGSDTCLGSVDNLYRSITNLDGGMYLKTENLKNLLLNPQLPPEYFSKNQIFPHTERMLVMGKEPVHFVDLNGKLGYVKGPATFMVTDDLTVTPSSALSSLTLIKNFGIPISDVEELEIEIRMKEALNLLKASLTSTSALTDGLKPVSKTQVKQEK